jgi:hypothetical protein
MFFTMNTILITIYAFLPIRLQPRRVATVLRSVMTDKQLANI